jgi:hypothetical protein
MLFMIMLVLVWLAILTFFFVLVAFNDSVAVA